MARRKKNVDFDDIEVNENTTLAQVVPPNTKQIIAQKPNGDVEMITLEDAKERKIVDYDNIKSNQEDIIRNGSIRSHFLDEDLKLFNRYFLKTLEGVQIKAEIYGEDVDENPEYILFQKFPLPDYFISEDNKKTYYQPDYEDIVVVITDYPQFPPFGIYMHKHAPNRLNIQFALKGHQYEEPIGHPDSNYARSVKGLKEKGWIWQCFHYRNNVWNFNPNDIKKGDSLTKYLENLFLAFCGVLHPDR